MLGDAKGSEEAIVDLGIDGLTDVTLAGKGGTSSVYKARNADGNVIAVKVFAGVWDDDRQRRFERELEAMVALDSIEGVVSLGEHGKTATGVTFFTMPFQPGGSLQDALKQEGPCSWQAAVGYIRNIAFTLQATHAQDIYHRDLKPANILLNVDGDPVITDFGTTEIADGRSISTIASYTPGFCPPEVLTKGRNGIDGVSCDVYALGAMLWSLLTANQPFVDAGKNGTDPMVLLNRLTNEPLARVDSAPSWVNDVIAFATDKDPNHRYQSVSDLIDDINNKGKEASEHQRAGLTQPSSDDPIGLADTIPNETEPTTTDTEAGTAKTSPSILNFATSKKGYIVMGLAVVAVAATSASFALRGNPDERAALGVEEGPESSVEPQAPLVTEPDSSGSPDETTPEQVVVDGELLASVQPLLPDGVTATVQNGIVVLTGEAATEAARAALEAQIAALEGVRSIQNNISVTEEIGSSIPPTSTETTLTSAVENATTTGASSNPRIVVRKGEFYGENHSAMAVSFIDFPPNATFRYTCITGQLGAPGQSYSTSFNITTDAQGNAERPGQAIGGSADLNCLVGPSPSVGGWVEALINDPDALALIKSNLLSGS